jgi:hypothetical protein
MRRDLIVTTLFTLGAISYYALTNKGVPPRAIIPLEVSPEVISKSRQFIKGKNEALKIYDENLKKAVTPIDIQTERKLNFEELGSGKAIKTNFTAGLSKIVEPPTPAILPPHERIGFGHDTSRNIDTKELDDYLNLPLEGSGVTYTNEYKYKDIDETSEPELPNRYKYIRLRILKSRSNLREIHLGDIDFSYRGHQLKLNTINPHTGSSVNFPWIDNDQLTLLIQLESTSEINNYRLKTSTDDPKFDPVRWVLEGSMNGAFWEIIDDRNESDEEFPTIRDVWIPYAV